jgi:hypothetical protein
MMTKKRQRRSADFKFRVALAAIKEASRPHHALFEVEVAVPSF